MKTTVISKCLTVCLAVLAVSCQPQKTRFYNKEFKWTISIPSDFQKTSLQDEAKTQNEGAQDIKKYGGVKVDVTGVKKILSFESAKVNSFIANYQIWDPSFGNYNGSLNSIHKLIYTTFKNKYPDMEIDTSASEENIDSLTFQKYNISLKNKNGVVTMVVYTRMFGNKEFTVTVNYNDPQKGKEILNAWRGSKFGKP